MTTVSHVLQKIADDDIRFVDLRFTDLQGKLRHITMSVSGVDERTFTDGVVLDSSSISCWRTLDESDIVLLPDLQTAHRDPFFFQPTLVMLCDVFDPILKKFYRTDSRFTAQKAEAYIQSLNIADTIHIGLETEFFIFDDVRYKTDPYNTSFKLDSNEFPSNDDRQYKIGNLGHRPRVRSAHSQFPPLDSCQNLRSEMLTIMEELGICTENHHHTVATAQHKVSIRSDTLVREADKMQILKYVVHQIANNYGKTATFMPKPIFGDNGSAMHVQMSIWKNGEPVFAGNGYAGLSETALFFIGGIIKHAKAVNAFANPSTNSYKRLVYDCDAPVLLTYSAHEHSAACRIPFRSSENTKRIEICFPDPTANPYLAFSALLMAGLDGIKNKIHPGPPLDDDLYDRLPKELNTIPTVADNLSEALRALDSDRDFLTVGDVFDNAQIDSFIELKRKEVLRYAMTPHPVEFDMYYSS